MSFKQLSVKWADECDSDTRRHKFCSRPNLFTVGSFIKSRDINNKVTDHVEVDKITTSLIRNVSAL